MLRIYLLSTLERWCFSPYSSVALLSDACSQRLIPAGSLIGEYVGEVMSEDDWQERQARFNSRVVAAVVLESCSFFVFILGGVLTMGFPQRTRLSIPPYVPLSSPVMVSEKVYLYVIRPQS